MGLKYGERIITNAVEEAVYVVLGGPTKASLAVRVSNQAIHNVLTQRIVRTAEMALAFEDATAAAGCRIPLRELAGKIEWEGPARHPELPKDGAGNSPNGSRSRKGRNNQSDSCHDGDEEAVEAPAAVEEPEGTRTVLYGSMAG